MVGALARRMLDAPGLHGRARADGRPRPRRSTAPTSCSSRSASAARRRGCATRPSRSRAAASARRRPAPAGSRRRCARCRSCSRSPSACASCAADGAWIVDFTNPVGIVTRALLDAGHRAVGLCNVAIGFQRTCARLLGVEPEQVVVDQVGLNHLTWVRAVRVDGDDVLPQLLDEHGDELAGRSGLPLRVSRGARRAALVLPALLLRARRVLAEQLGGTPRALEVWRSRAACSSSTATLSCDEKPALLEQRGGAFYSEAASGSCARSRPATGRCTRWTFATPERSRASRTTTSSRCLRASTRDSVEPLRAGAARAGAARARPARRRVRAARRRGGGDAATRAARARRCWPTR